MYKLKTHKATSKRIIVTPKGKFLKRKSGQDHFNSRESGNTTRNKRRDITFSPAFTKTITIALPNK